MNNKCDICGEPLRPNDEVAEMYDPDQEENETLAEMYGTVVCHADCGLSRGYQLA